MHKDACASSPLPSLSRLGERLPPFKYVQEYQERVRCSPGALLSNLIEHFIWARKRKVKFLHHHAYQIVSPAWDGAWDGSTMIQCQLHGGSRCCSARIASRRRPDCRRLSLKASPEAVSRLARACGGPALHHRWKPMIIYVWLILLQKDEKSSIRYGRSNSLKLKFIYELIYEFTFYEFLYEFYMNS